MSRFLDALNAGIKAALNQYTKPDSYVKGEQFETYVRETLFPAHRYKLLHKTAGYEQNKKDYVESSKEPDYFFECIRTGRKFHIECKFRSFLNGGKLEWCKSTHQLARYHDINRSSPVFIAIGLQGTPLSPDHVFVLPVKHIKYTGLYPSVFEPFEVHKKKHMDSSELWNALKSR